MMPLAACPNGSRIDAGTKELMYGVVLVAGALLSVVLV